MKILLLSLLFLFSTLHSALIDTDTFDSSLDGWSGPSISRISGEMRILGTTTATKTYNLGAAYISTVITISFNSYVPNDWDNTGGAKDYYKVLINGSLAQTYLSSGGDIDKSFTATTDTNGDITIVFYADVTHAAKEHIFLEDITLSDYITPSSFTCANPKIFTSIYNVNEFQKMLFIGNTSLCANDGSGNCEDPGTSTNNNINMMHNDYDDINGTSDNTSTLVNSSAAYLDIPAGKEVLFASLFWQGYMVDFNSTAKSLGQSIKYKHQDSASYESETTTEMNWVYFNSTRMYYQSRLDITTYVNDKGAGYYWVGDIATTEGQPAGGSFGAWAMLVVYQDNDEDFSNVNIFHGYQAFAGATDINNAIAYANTNNCPTTTGVGTNVSSTLSGFLTPTDNLVDSSLAVFAGEGDIGLTGDTGSITDENGVAHTLSNALNPSSNIMNATISKNGVSVTSGVPYYSANTLGADIDIYDVSNIIGNEQSTTDITFTSSGDGYMPGMYALQTTLYAPKLCYDYSYSQNNRFITEINNGDEAPRLDPRNNQHVTINEPITLKLFIRNEELSDTIATNVKLNLLDIGDCIGANCQAEYILNTTHVSPVNSSILVPIADVDANTNYINNVAIDDITSQGYFYTSFLIDPLVSDINMSINARLDYSLQLFDSNGDPLLPNPIEYKQFLDSKIPLCNAGAFLYNPEKNIFNIVHDNYYTSFIDGTIGGTYNLPTQVVKRDGNFHIIATDSNTSVANNTNMDLLKATTTVVGIEIIDAGGWQDAETSCAEDDTRRSYIVWVGFDENTTNAPLNNAVLTGTDLIHHIFIDHPNQGSVNDIPLFSTAIESAAFRITYFGTNNGINPDFKKGSLRGWYLDNYTEYAGSVCVNDPDLTNPDTAIETVSEHCGDNSGHGIDDFEMCIKCLYGSNIKRICSRDNFSIRPEAFLLSIQDQYQLNLNTTPKPIIVAGNITSVRTHLAAGYQYELNATAVTHTNNDGSFRYTNSFTNTLDNSGKFIYTSKDALNTNCNDYSDSDIAFSFTLDTGKGSINNSLIDQVGTYQLSMLDNTWTLVDQNPSHHTTVNNVDNFTTGTANIYDDCVKNTATVSAQNDSNLTGCNISSTHTSLDTVRSFQSPLLEFHPYKFELISITPTVGLNHTDVNATSYIYMADMSVSSDENMSYHLNGIIKAVGENNATLSNFVDNCYAKPLNIDLNKSVINLPVAYQYRFKSLDENGTVIRTTNADLNNSGNFISVTTADFTKALNGSADTVFNLNYNRTKNNPQNPDAITFFNYDVECTNDVADCTFNADLIANKTAKGTQDLNATISIKHYYGRTHAKRQRYVVPAGTGLVGNQIAQDFIYYEVYSVDGNKTMLQDGLNSTTTDDPRWHINTKHTSDFGTAGSIFQKNAANVTGTNTSGNHQDSTNLVYNGNRGYVYKATMENNASNWLIYNKYNANAVRNEFEVEFDNNSSSWAGQHETNTTTKQGGSVKTNRRSMW